MTTTGMNHFTVLTDDVDAHRRFYRDFVGLAEVPARPWFPGAWLYAGTGDPAHRRRPRRSARPGVIDHMAFSARGCARRSQLDAHGVDVPCRQQVGSGIWQVFFLDPNGARVELDFAPEDRRRLTRRHAAGGRARPPRPGRDHARGRHRIRGEITGVMPRPGGKHGAMGTHNALLRLWVRVYLEIIAIDPGRAARGGAGSISTTRRFSGADRAAAAHHWVARATDIERRRCLPGAARPRACDGARGLSLEDDDSRTTARSPPRHRADAYPVGCSRSIPRIRSRLRVSLAGLAAALRSRPGSCRARGAGARRHAPGHLRPRTAARGDAGTPRGIVTLWISAPRPGKVVSDPTFPPSAERTPRCDRPHTLDARPAHADDPVVEIDRRITVTRNQPEPVAEARRPRIRRDRDHAVLVRCLHIGRSGWAP